MLAPMNVVMCCHYCLLSMYRLLLQGCDGEKRRGRPSCLESERRERGHREAGRERRGPTGAFFARSRPGRWQLRAGFAAVFRHD